MTTTSASIDTICVHCGGKKADAQTGRCVSCGKQAISPQLVSEFSHPVLDRHSGESRQSPSAAYRTSGTNGPEPSNGQQTGEADPRVTPEVINRAAAWALAPADPSPSAATFRLPDSPATTKWIDETKALRDKLLAQASKAEEQVKALLVQSQSCRESAEGFDRLLAQIAVGDRVPTAAAVVEPTPAKALGKWSKNADACIDCGRSDLPHCANGRCRPCDGHWRARGSRG